MGVRVFEQDNFARRGVGVFEQDNFARMGVGVLHLTQEKKTRSQRDSRRTWMHVHGACVKFIYKRTSLKMCIYDDRDFY
jgi:hypothetical protein